MTISARPPRPTGSYTRRHVTPRWWVVDAAEQTAGRLASRVAVLLRGKHRPQYTPHDDVGDFVVVVNAERVHFSGRKREQKLYHRHTGWPGSIKTRTAAQILDGAHPERVIERAVRGMLPKNSLGRRLYRKLKVYAGPDHPHSAQQPEELSLG